MMHFKFHVLFVLLFTFCLSHTDAFVYESNARIATEYKHWFTGPINMVQAGTADPAHPNFEFDLFASRQYGKYDSEGKVERIPIIRGLLTESHLSIGFSKHIGIVLIGTTATNFCEGHSFTSLGDSIFRLGYQFTFDQADSWIPDSRLFFQEIFPTGKYDHLHSKYHGVDITGQGSYQSALRFVVMKAFHANTPHPFRLGASLSYYVPASAHLKGLNLYGGGAHTHGRAHLGKYYEIFLFGEYALSRTWNIACETRWVQGDKGHFTGKSHKAVSIPYFSQLYIYPELQHSYSENLAIIIGGWFTVLGRNTPAYGRFTVSALYIF